MVIDYFIASIIASYKPRLIYHLCIYKYWNS